MSGNIASIQGREILDSRGNPTVSVRVVTDDGVVGVAAVPSGASTGSHEALELRDGDTSRYAGKGVLGAVTNVNTMLAPALVGMAVVEQKKIDQMMVDLDATPNKSKLGANALLGVSLACARAGAVTQGLPLYHYLRTAFSVKKNDWVMPLPMMNLLNGGAHAGFAIDFQESMVIPQMARFSERVRIGSEIFHGLAKILKTRGFVTTVGDEGGYAPHLSSNEEALALLMEAIAATGYEAGEDVRLGLDVAASEFYDAEKKIYSLKVDKCEYDGDAMIALLSDLAKKYPLMSIEDGLAEDDWDHWQKLTATTGNTTTLVGDDLFVTNTERLQMGIDQRVANAILIKVNQIGTLSETMAAIALAQQNNYKIAISHRSGETADTFIADLAVAVGADFIKTGSLSRSERVEKYNRLMEIENEV